MSDGRAERDQVVRENEALRRRVAALEAEAERCKAIPQSIGDAVKFPDENPSPVLRFAADGTLLYANASSTALLDRWRCQIGGQPPHEVRRTIIEALATGTNREIEAGVGGIVYALALVPVHGADYLNVYGSDITVRKKAADALRESEARNRATLYSIGDAVIAVAADGCIVQMNPVAEKLTGWTEPEALGKPLAEVFRIVNEETRAVVESPVERVLREGVVVGLANHTLLIAKDSTERPIADSGAPIRNEKGETTGVVLVFRDQTEERRAERELRATEEQFRTFFDNAPIGKCMTAPEGRLLRVNPALSAMLGYSVEELQTLSFGPITHPDDLAETQKAVRALLAGERDIWAMDKRFLAKDGRPVWTHVTTRLQRDDQGKPLHLLTHIQDITERRATEARLVERETQFRATFEQAAVGIAHVGLEGAWLRVNQRLCDIVGYTSDELLHKTFQDITHPDDLDTDNNYVRQILSGEIQTYSMEKRYIRKDRSLVWINLTVGPVRDDTGALKYFVSVVEDISARKRAQAELDVSQRRLISMINAITESAFLMEPDGTILVANGAVAERLGTTPAAMVGRSVFDSLPSDLAQGRRLRMAEVMQTRAVVHFEDCRGERHIWNSIYPVFDAENAIRQLAVFGYDITERKQAEEQIARLNSELEAKVVERTAKLKDEMELIQKIISSSPVGVFACRADGPCVVANPAIAAISGTSVEKMLQLNFHELDSWKENGLFDKVQAALATGVDQRAEVHLTTTFGRDAWLNYTVTTFERAGTPHFLMMVEDITDRKTKEEEIRLSRQRLDLHVKHTPLAVIEFTRDGHIARWNPAAAEIFGFSEEEAVGQHWTFIAPEEVRGHLDGVWEGLVSQSGGGRSTNLNRHKSGRTLRCEWFNTPLVAADGTAMGVASLVMDVTERNLAQEDLARHRDHLQELVQARTAELQVSEARLIEAQRVARVGNWEWDVVSDAISASEEFYRLFDVEPERIARYQQFVECLHPDDRERVGTEVNEALRQSRVYDTDYRVRLRDGRWRDIHARGELFTDVDGKPVRLAGTCLDITERKQAEAAVRESEARYRATLYSIGDAVIATDAESRIIGMNPVAERLTGWLEGEAQGKPLGEVFRIVNEETRAAVESPVTRVLREGQVVGLANHTLLIAKGGTERPIADSGAPIRDEKGETTGVVLVFRDQTEERRAGDALRRSETILRAVIEGTTNLVCVKDQRGRIIIANSAMTRFIGKPESEIIGKSDLELVADAQQAAKILENDRHIMATGDSQTVEETGKGAAGRWDYLFTKSPYHDLDGQVIGVIGIGTDITERKRAENALREQYAILRAILQSTDSSVFSLDREYRYTTFNDGHAATMKALYGVDIQIGASLAEYQSVPEDWQLARKNLDRALQGETFVKSAFSGDEVRSRRYFEISHSPIRTSANEIIGVSVYSRDVTERKRAEDEIRLLNVSLEQRVRDRTAQLEESNKELEAFSYSVSHDLRAPLRAIDGFTRILADDYASQLDTEGQRLCSVVRGNTGKMSQLIDDLLAFSRLGRAQMNLSDIDMGAMANAVFHELTTPESRARIDFQVGDLPPAVADPTLMRQVWMNLLSNAIKFSSKRERAVIKVSARQKQGEIAYVVQDDGAGFDMQYVDKVFGVFQRLHSSKEFEGTGVGLALVQRVIRRHGGRVWAEGEPDKGATISFTLQEPGE
jgi:PAS domain S-box-containing protein